MPFKEGDAKPENSGRKQNVKNKKTEQWEQFAEYCATEGLAKFKEELNKLSGKDYIAAFTNLLEFHQPKLARNENENNQSGKIVIEVKHV